MALGWLEKMLWFTPTHNITVASFGHDLGGSTYCGVAVVWANGSRKTNVPVGPLLDSAPLLLKPACVEAIAYKGMCRHAEAQHALATFDRI